jgi:hypothetical protein
MKTPNWRAKSKAIVALGPSLKRFYQVRKVSSFAILNSGSQ